MARAKNPAADRPKEPTTAADFDPTPAPPAKSSCVAVVLRRDCQCGDTVCPAGTKLAEVRLKPGVSLNYLVDAVRSFLAGEVLLDEAPAQELPID